MRRESAAYKRVRGVEMTHIGLLISGFTFTWGSEFNLNSWQRSQMRKRRTWSSINADKFTKKVKRGGGRRKRMQTAWGAKKKTATNIISPTS